jgi:hypothetical protein
MPSFFTSHKAKRLLRKQSSGSDVFTMSDISISSSTDSRPLSRDYDTGFPESLEAHTTSMRHPDANTAPNAFITADDIDPARSFQRCKKSLLHKHRRTISQGSIPTIEVRRMQGPALETIVSPMDSAIDVDEHRLEMDSALKSPSKDHDGAEKSGQDQSPLSSPAHSPTQYGHRRKTSNPFKRWM